MPSIVNVGATDLVINTNSRGIPLLGGPSIAAGLTLMESMDLWIDGALDFPNRGSGTYTSQSGNSFTIGPTAGAEATEPLTTTASSLGYFLFPALAVEDVLTTPDRAALRIAGDFEIRALIQLQSLDNGYNGIISKGTEAYELGHTASGAMVIRYGTLTATGVVSDANLIAAGATRWVRVTVDVNNGSGGYTVNFYYSDQITVLSPDDVTWTLHSTHTAATLTAPDHTSTRVLAIGRRQNTSNFVHNGRIYQLQVRDGIAGTVVLYLNGSSAGHKTFADAYGNTFTVGRNLTIYPRLAWVPPNSGWALMDGNNDHIQYNAPTMRRDANGEFTIMAWYVHTGLTDRAILSFSGNGAVAGGYIFVKYDDGDVQTNAYTNDTVQIVQTTTTEGGMVAGDFVVWVCRFAANGTITQRFYVNDNDGYNASVTSPGVAGSPYMDTADPQYIGQYIGALRNGDQFGGVAARYDLAILDDDLDNVAAYIRSIYAP